MTFEPKFFTNFYIKKEMYSLKPNFLQFFAYKMENLDNKLTITLLITITNRNLLLSKLIRKYNNLLNA